MKKRTLLLSAGLILLAGLALMGPIMSRVEEPKYDMISSDNSIEIRQYKPMIVAQVTVQGERKEAISEGFRLLADYIFGNNTVKDKIAMTAPVTQQQSQSISMTRPVIQKSTDEGWNIQFVMPTKYTLDTLPKPINKAIKLREIPAKRFAVIRFSGMHTKENISLNEKTLRSYLTNKKIKTVSTPLYAFYNPPWTLPFLRRNEVMIEIQ